MEWDLYFSPIGHPFHLGILITQIFPNNTYIDAIRVPPGWGQMLHIHPQQQLQMGS
jgi:oxalate decarboxylase/phosphoglucose isomerase-like protein (cupin superfamily)